ncbi:hypothetical protein RhiJN_26239 [Ceratobasidium sp. AG-Ba]|nr:hypothetical protein RhiJN_26239 [Ceratobasidium sp. AG-Ba]
MSLAHDAPTTPLRARRLETEWPSSLTFVAHTTKGSISRDLPSPRLRLASEAIGDYERCLVIGGKISNLVLAFIVSSRKPPQPLEIPSVRDYLPGLPTVAEHNDTSVSDDDSHMNTNACEADGESGW